MRSNFPNRLVKKTTNVNIILQKDDVKTELGGRRPDFISMISGI